MQNGSETTQEQTPAKEQATAISIPSSTPESPVPLSLQPWILWLLINLIIALYFLSALFAPASDFKASWLPGETTHGHYQIELDCNACHDSSDKDSDHTAENVMQDACIRCHGDQLKLAKDTHPAKKFNDPTNAELLEVINAQDCLSCHREHVPEQTLTMGLTMPSDYCWHCHQEVADSRPSHEGMAFDSCATAGCHNYHDNRALYEKYLGDHHGEPDHLPTQKVASRNLLSSWLSNKPDHAPLASYDADVPAVTKQDKLILKDWAETAHAAAGVNCTGCHITESENGSLDPANWSDQVSMDTCESCHERQVESFQRGKHGMRLAAEMSPMKPSDARLPMHVDAAHRELTCNACHEGHRFDTQYAASEACLKCHADDHSLAYLDSGHAALWQKEISGEAASGSGVSCATCHLPRLSDGDDVWVNHDQNASLRPNETMAREVCASCHGLEYALSSLSDPMQVKECFQAEPETRTESVEMAHEWFRIQEEKRNARKRKRSSK